MAVYYVKILGGDLPEVRCRLYRSLFGNTVLSVPGTLRKPFGEWIRLNKSVAGLYPIDEERKKGLLGTAGWAFIGGVTLGGIGLIAGALAGGNKREVTFACELKDGRKFVAVADQGGWRLIVPFTVA